MQLWYRVPRIDLHMMLVTIDGPPYYACRTALSAAIRGSNQSRSLHVATVLWICTEGQVRLSKGQHGGMDQPNLKPIPRDLRNVVFADVGNHIPLRMKPLQPLITNPPLDYPCLPGGIFSVRRWEGDVLFGEYS